MPRSSPSPPLEEGKGEEAVSVLSSLGLLEQPRTRTNAKSRLNSYGLFGVFRGCPSVQSDSRLTNSGLFEVIRSVSAHFIFRSESERRPLRKKTPATRAIGRNLVQS